VNQLVLSAAAQSGAAFAFTGASLGGGATNLMANIAGSAFGGAFAAATFVGFASPNISTAAGILNVGFENDPIYKALNGYADFPSSLDNLVLATSQYMAGNYNGFLPLDYYAHSSVLGFGRPCRTPRQLSISNRWRHLWGLRAQRILRCGLALLSPLTAELQHKGQARLGPLRKYAGFTRDMGAPRLAFPARAPCGRRLVGTIIPLNLNPSSDIWERGVRRPAHPRGTVAVAA
jgi:hypothetical protein